MLNQFFHITRKTSFRIFALGLISCYVIGLLYWFNLHTPASEKIPHIHLPTKNVQKYATNITVGFHISGFPIFSFAKNEFQIDGVLWFQFPAGTEALKSLDSFTFQDSVLLYNGHLIYKSQPIVSFVDQDVLVCYQVQANVKGRLNYKYFPLCDHKLILILQNKNVSSHEMCLHSHKDYLTLADDLLIRDWKPAEKTVLTGYTSAYLRETKDVSLTYPSVIFSIDFEDIGIKTLTSLYFPLLVLFFIGLFSLFFELASEARLTFTAASVPILVLFRMVIDAVSPQVGYTTHIDFFYNFLVFLSLIILMFQTYVMLAMQKIKSLTEEIQQKTKESLDNMNDLIFIGNLVALVVLVTYSFYR